jgi:hypothetical protein
LFVLQLAIIFNAKMHSSSTNQSTGPSPGTQNPPGGDREPGKDDKIVVNESGSKHITPSTKKVFFFDIMPPLQRWGKRKEETTKHPQGSSRP